MDKMKKFFKLFLAFALLFVFSNLVISALLKNSYTKIKDYNIDVTVLYVDITEAKASNWNGNVKGVVKNNTEEVVENKYLKFNFMSKKDRLIGEKYVKIDRIEPGQLRNFEVDFDYDNIKTFKIELTDTMPEGVSFIELVKDNVKDLTREMVK